MFEVQLELHLPDYNVLCNHQDWRNHRKMVATAQQSSNTNCDLHCAGEKVNRFYHVTFTNIQIPLEFLQQIMSSH